MKSDCRLLLVIFLALPFAAFASGDYVIPAMFIDLILLLVITIAIVKTNLHWKGKVILFLIYLIAMCVLFFFIDQLD